MKIDLSAIKQVYSGKADKCACGCAGTYFEDDRNKKRIAKLLEQNPETQREDGCENEEIFSVVIGTRVYVAYVTRTTPVEPVEPAEPTSSTDALEARSTALLDAYEAASDLSHAVNGSGAMVALRRVNVAFGTLWTLSQQSRVDVALREATRVVDQLTALVDEPELDRAREHAGVLLTALETLGRAFEGECSAAEAPAPAKSLLQTLIEADAAYAPSCVGYFLHSDLPDCVAVQLDEPVGDLLQAILEQAAERALGADDLRTLAGQMRGMTTKSAGTFTLAYFPCVNFVRAPGPTSH